MKKNSSESESERPTTSGVPGIPNQASSTKMAHEKTQKRVGKRPGRKPSKIDQKAKLERSRQSARECRARKKLRYQYLEELVSSREKAVFSLRDELEMYRRWCSDLDRGVMPDGLLKVLAQEEMQKSLNTQTSPRSQDSTPSASPASLEVDQQQQQFSGQVTTAGHPSRPTGQHPAASQFVGQLPGQPRRQDFGQLSRQPSTSVSGQQVLTSMHRGSRSFEEVSQPSSSSSSTSPSSSMYRAGSVPNLAAASSSSSTKSLSRRLPATGYSPLLQAPSTSSLVYRDFDQLEDDEISVLNSTGFTPVPETQQLVTASFGRGTMVRDSDKAGSGNVAGGNIPTLISHHSPPLVRSGGSGGGGGGGGGVGQPSSVTWTWDQSVQVVGEADSSAVARASSYPVTCAASSGGHSSRTPSSVPYPPQSVPHGFRGGSVFSASSVSSGASCTVTSGSLAGQGSPEAVVVSDHLVPDYYQRPRSSSDLVRRVTSTALPRTTTSAAVASTSLSLSSLSQQDLPGLLSPATSTTGSAGYATSGSQDLFAAISEGVATCLTLQSSARQDSAPAVCVSSEPLMPSISEPIPQWYSFLDDLESAASLSARRGAFSDAGTPGSSRNRSGPGTPSSVDSPYSQTVPQQPQEQQQQQQQQDRTDGNIPNIISDLLGPNPPS